MRFFRLFAVIGAITGGYLSLAAAPAAATPAAANPLAATAAGRWRRTLNTAVTDARITHRVERIGGSIVLPRLSPTLHRPRAFAAFANVLRPSRVCYRRW